MSLLRTSRIPASMARSRSANAQCISRRSVNDLANISVANPNASFPPLTRSGPHTGGRSANSGHTVTVFGSTGFLARYLIQKLARQGSQVVVPYRDEDEKRRLRPCGDLGQIVPLEWDARIPEQTADPVYCRNCYRNERPPSHSCFPSQRQPKIRHPEFYRTKYAGERAVRDAFPEATIVRPSQLFGYEDWLLNAIARYPILYKLNQGRTKLFPVHVVDVAEALNKMLNAPVTSAASTFALPGPELYSFAELERLVSSLLLKPVSSAPSLPKSAAKLIATLLNRGLWWPTISPDEIERMYIDDAGVTNFQATTAGPDGWGVAPPPDMTGIDGEPVKSWIDLDMKPDTISEHAIKPLRRFRSAATFDLPVETNIIKSPKQYHVLP
uniref:Putative NADH dehydrogenase n=1 Tax=Cryptococcus depauperatus TaxID=5208 RepID=D2JWU8_9TREE|nr:putative NADH dehydrogenase [Cryptococcus depauperatus]